MAVTPNYSWPVPVATDYVKDGYSAIADLGDAIDATVFGLPSGALTLVKTQTIGTAVSSVIVTGAFSATYNNYLVMVSNTANSNANDNLAAQLRVGSTTSTTGYYSILAYWAYSTGSPGVAGTNNGSSWTAVGRGLGTGEKISYALHLQQPFLANKTVYSSLGVMGGDLTGHSSGYHGSLTSYDQIVLNTGGTFTGGNIYIYGYGLS